MKEHQLFNGWGVQTQRGDPPMTAVARFLTPDGKCVYGSSSMGAPNAAQQRIITGLKLRTYDVDVEKQRRLVCDSALGQLALDNQGPALDAVRMVNMGIRHFVGTLHQSGNFNLPFVIKVPDKPDRVTSVGEQGVAADGKYVSNGTSFGRLGAIIPEQLSDVAKQRVPSEKAQKARQLRGQMDSWMAAMNEPDLARQIGLHDVFLKVYCTFESAKAPLKKPLTPKDLATEMHLREDWYDNAKLRGRINNPAFETKKFSSSEPGLINASITIAWQDILTRCGVNLANTRTEARQRGVDANLRDNSILKLEYGKILDTHNLLFVASVSGTTSTLFTSAYIFAPGIRGNLELSRKYLFGCIAYLVGGGMHSCDEVFFTGGKTGLNYQSGKYLDMLPSSFLRSEQGQKWKDEFWEIVRPDRTSPQ